MKSFIIAIFLVALLPACSTFDPYTGEKKTTNTAKGAGIGAGVAAVAAFFANKDEKDSRKRNERVLRAAAGGAVIGGGIGYYMDTQEAKLRQQLGDSGVSVVRDGENINLVMPGNITYATSSSDLNTSFTPVLDSVALVLKEFDKTLVVVSGHTDSVGDASFNQSLSERRASSVSMHLRSKGIDNDRLETIGYGETRPVASNDTAAGKEQNRRVEIKLVPIEEK